MTRITVRRAPDVDDISDDYISTVRQELEQQFEGVRCFPHNVVRLVIATIQKGRQVDIDVRGCCRQLAAAVDVVLAQYHRTRSR